MHANFWESEKLQEKDWLINKDKDGNIVPIPFHNFCQMYLSADKNDFTQRYIDCLIKGAGIDFYDTEELKSVINLFRDHAEPMLAAVYKRLSSRPKTLVHGDLRTDNLFNSKTDPNVFRVIDWQIPSFTSPGVEWSQMIGSALEPEEIYEEIDTLYDAYLEGLHSKNEASKSYTK